jgi:hypothetical protein
MNNTVNTADESSCPCALCGAVAPLERSHIIPQFVFRWLKETSSTGHIRFGPQINKRVQDGINRQLLCGKCEDRFSVWETKFSKHVFHPLVGDKFQTIKYEDWLLKFSVSVCWRIYEEAYRHNQFRHYKGRHAAQLVSCREVWRRFLIGELPDVGEHHIHMLRWDGIIGGEGPELPTNINRYLRRAIEMDAPSNDSHGFIYGKLGPIILLGMVAYPGPKQWRGTRIYKEGKLKIRDTLAPVEYRDYVLARARRMLELENGISEHQMKKIAESTKLDRLANSGTLKATEMDIDLFGDAAAPKS